MTDNEPRVRAALEVLCEEGQLYEVRGLAVPQGRYTAGTVAGYYYDLDAMARDAATLSRQGACGVYVILNPIEDRCFARSMDRLTTGLKTTTNDEDVVERRWLLVDIDVQRPAGLSSTDEEHELALEHAKHVAEAMQAEGWPAPVRSDSGNGAHLMWRIRLPNDGKGGPAEKLVNGVLHELNRRFGTEKLKVDRTCGNAARIWKCPGTMARKGDEYRTMRHREAALLDPGDGELLTREQMESFVAFEPEPENTAAEPRPAPVSSWDAETLAEVERFVDEHYPAARRQDYNGGFRWRIPCWRVPGGHSGGPAARIIITPEGEVHAGCSGDRCVGKPKLGDGWTELQAHHGVADDFAPTEDDIAELTTVAEAVKAKVDAGEDAAADTWRKWLLMSPPNKDGEERILKRVHNAGLFLEHHGEVKGCFGFDEMLDRVVCLRRPRLHRSARAGFAVGEPLEDHHEVELVRWLERRAAHSYGTSTVHGLVDRVARVTRSFHPVRDYLTRLEWDGEVRLTNWLQRYAGAEDTRYHRCVGTWWLISAVARAFDPGCKVDHMLILEGAQGAGKSTTFRILGGDWFSDTELPIGRGGPDAYQLLSGVWIYELAELSGMDFKQIEQVKAYLTSSTDKFRKSYGRNPGKKPRNTVFAGTTNSDRYLRDTTGNRRFWPVRIRGSDLEALAEDRDQLWAEAVVRYHAGEEWWPSSPEQVQMCVAAQRERTERDPWEDILTDWLLSNQRFGFVATTELFAKALDLPKAQQHAGNGRRLADAMSAIGWVRDRKRNGSRKIRGFAPSGGLQEPDTDLPI